MNMKAIKNMKTNKELVIAILILWFFGTMIVGNFISNYDLVWRAPFVIEDGIKNPKVSEAFKQKVEEENLVKQVMKDMDIDKLIEEEVKKTCPQASPEAVKQVLLPKVEGSISSIINKWADYYGVNRNYAHCIAFKESSYNCNAVGDGGKAVGLYQFHLPSWVHVRKEMGLSTVDKRDDPEEATKTAMFAMANGYSKWWTTIRFCGGAI